MMAVKPFMGTGIGRFYPVGAIFYYIRKILMPMLKDPILVNNCKMLVQIEEYKGIEGMAQELLFKGTHEPYTTALFKKLVKEGITVVDIGAHIGYFSLLAASLVGEKGRVFAFEPEPRNYAILIKNIELNGFNNVIPLQMAVSNETGKVKLFLARDPSAHSLFRATEADRREDFTKFIMVNTVSLDEFFKGKDLHVDIIKMDAEGAEMMILQGMTQVLLRNDKLLLIAEFNPSYLQNLGLSPQAYWNMLMQFGHKFIYLINEDEKKLETADLETAVKYCEVRSCRDRDPYANLLCSKSAFNE
jgi:FkbM family methyltransferase